MFEDNEDRLFGDDEQEDGEELFATHARAGNLNDVRGAFESHTGVLLMSRTRPVLDELTSKLPPLMLPMVEATPLLGDLHAVLLATRDTEVRVMMLRDGDVTVEVKRNNKLIRQIDVPHEPGVTPVANPACPCASCVDRAERIKKQEEQCDAS